VGTFSTTTTAAFEVRVEVWMERFANGNYLLELASWFQIIPGCGSWCLSHPS